MNRRDFLLSTATSTAIIVVPTLGYSTSSLLIKRPIPSSGKQIPCVGMGTWKTFDIDPKLSNISHRTRVLQKFFSHGGGMIDSSPMYGSAQTVLGKCFQHLEVPKTLFSATKVWTPGEWLGTQQMKTSIELWGLNNFDLMQIHNLLDWKTHLMTLRDWKESKRIRYIVSLHHTDVATKS